MIREGQTQENSLVLRFSLPSQPSNLMIRAGQALACPVTLPKQKNS